MLETERTAKMCIIVTVWLVSKFDVIFFRMKLMLLLINNAGLPVADAPKKISGVHKRCWRYIPGLIKSIENKPKSENAPTAEVQAA